MMTPSRKGSAESANSSSTTIINRDSKGAKSHSRISSAESFNSSASFSPASLFTTPTKHASKPTKLHSRIGLAESSKRSSLAKTSTNYENKPAMLCARKRSAETLGSSAKLTPVRLTRTSINRDGKPPTPHSRTGSAESFNSSASRPALTEEASTALAAFAANAPSIATCQGLFDLSAQIQATLTKYLSTHASTLTKDISVTKHHITFNPSSSSSLVQALEETWLSHRQQCARSNTLTEKSKTLREKFTGLKRTTRVVELGTKVEIGKVEEMKKGLAKVDKALMEAERILGRLETNPEKKARIRPRAVAKRDNVVFDRLAAVQQSAERMLNSSYREQRKSSTRMVGEEYWGVSKMADEGLEH